MNWHYFMGGSHTHIRVFMNGAFCGKITLRNEEFEQIRRLTPSGPPLDTVSIGGTSVTFIPETI